MLNKVHLIGYVGKDPELRMCPDGTALMKFSLATSESFVTKTKEKKTITEWHNIKVFNATDFQKSNITKGKLLYVEGKIKTETYTTKSNETKSMVSIYAYNIRILNEKSQSSTPNLYSNENREQHYGDIPF